MPVESIHGNPTPEEVAAIVAAVAALEQERAATARAGFPPDHLRMWVHASRRAAQRAGMQRGPWRMSGRLPRRSRT